MSDVITTAYKMLREVARIVEDDGDEIYDVTVWRDDYLRFFYRDARAKHTYDLSLWAGVIVEQTPQETIAFIRDLTTPPKNGSNDNE